MYVVWLIRNQVMHMWYTSPFLFSFQFYPGMFKFSLLREELLLLSIKQQYTWNVLWMYNLYCETSNLFFSVSSSTMECSSFCCCECNSSSCLSNNNHVHEMIICTPSVLWNNFKSQFFLTCWTFVFGLLAYNCLFIILISILENC